ncbi:hypothetical protein COU59_00860 [Candidatus Pacearchaeota archaeon CG10_big_fil_rev_8_21_14_0_10_34_12]|nr:MAG: hypothetical protein COU59_00860 [Candidatus Pacearchaeota archaeon CG10_big_fil_rev_8_21_14_0_10_34_12]
MKNLDCIPAIILAGGKGLRIRKIIGEIPKPLLNIEGYSLLEHTLLPLKDAGIKKFIVSIGLNGRLIKDCIGYGEKYDVDIDYVEESSPLGDAGAFKYSFPAYAGTVLLANADEIRIGLNLEQMLAFHKEKGGLSTMAIIKQPNIKDHGIVELDEENRIKRFLMNPDINETESKYANAGLYFMEKRVLEFFPGGHCMMKNVLKDIAKTQELFGFPFVGKYFNVGTPGIFNSAQKYFKSQRTPLLFAR